MLIQKLYRNGNSVAVTIPSQYLKELHLREGSKVVVEKKGNQLFIAPQKTAVAKDVNAKFMQMVDSFIADHEDVLRELSKR